MAEKSEGWKDGQRPLYNDQLLGVELGFMTLTSRVVIKEPAAG